MTSRLSAVFVGALLVGTSLFTCLLGGCAVAGSAPTLSGTADAGGGTGGGGAAGGGVEAPPDQPPPILGNGLSEHEVEEGSFLMYEPRTVAMDDPVPVVFAFPGFAMDGETMRVITAFDRMADANNFVVIFPTRTFEDVGGREVCGIARLLTPNPGDSMGFFTQMLDSVESLRALDRDKVFVTGFSLGGFFSSTIGCHRPELVRAIAPHSGGGPGIDCIPSSLPVMILHGTDDPVVDYECVSTQSRARWAIHNGCSVTSFDEVQLMNGVCEVFHGCAEGGETRFCYFKDPAEDKGMGHGWAGAEGFRFFAGGTQYEDATQLLWDFFASTL